MYKPWMAATPLLLVIGAWQLFAGTTLTETNQIQFQQDFTGKPLPKWQNGALLVRDAYNASAVNFSVFDSAGNKLLSHVFYVIGAKHLTVRDAARTADGTIGLCGGVIDADGRGSNYVAFINPANSATTLLRTDLFMASKITYASDGTFWVAGAETTPKTGDKSRTFAEALNKNAAVFRQFDKTGKLLRSAVPNSAIVDPVTLSDPSNVFGEVAGEIIWYSSRSHQLIAISRNGSYSEVRDLKLPEDQIANGFAITGKGEIIVTARGTANWSVLKLQDSRRDWQTIMHGANADKGLRQVIAIGMEGDVLTALGAGASDVRTFKVTD